MIIKDFLEKVQSESYEQRVFLARNSLPSFQPFCDFLDDKYGDGSLIVAGVVITAINADSEIRKEEIKFIGDVFKMTEADVRSLISHDPDRISLLVEALANFIAIDEFAKAQLCVFIATILVADNRIDLSEENYLMKILNRTFFVY